MPLFFDRSSPGTSVNIDSDVAKRSNTTFTSARKFSAPNSEEQETKGSQVISNDEHLIEQAATLKGVAIAAEQIALVARGNLATVRDQINSTQSSQQQDSRSIAPAVMQSDVANTSDANSKNLFDYLQTRVPLLETSAIADDLHKNITETVFKNKTDVPAPSAFNQNVPQLVSITVDMAKNRGTVDCFFSHLRFNLPLSQVWNKNVKAVRIFRSTILNPTLKRGTMPVLTMRGMERLSTLKSRSRAKGGDQLGPMEIRYREAGVMTATSILNPIDPATNARISTNMYDGVIGSKDSSTTPASDTQSTQTDISSFLDASRFSGIDAGVAQNLNVLRNIKMQDPSSAHLDIPQQFTLNTAEARQKGLLNTGQVTSLASDITSQIVIDKNNTSEFREIAFMSLDKLKSTITGDVVEYDFVDESVGFGRGYSYYIVSIDHNMMESIRSQIVDVTIEGIRVPERPKRVFSYKVNNAIALNILVDDQLVEKFEIHKREADSSLIKDNSLIVRNFSDVKGFNVNASIVKRSSNMFIKAGECLNGSKGSGATFYDRDTITGRKYMYRVYSVDVFGNKSESPYEVEMFLQDSSRPNELIKPTLSAEMDAKTGKSRIVFKCTDKRVRMLFLARRDLTVGQSAFTTPSQVNMIKFGTPKSGEGSKHFEDIVLRGENKDYSWTGMFQNSLEETTFIDKTVSLDHIYQYSIYGVDVFGNETSHEISKPFMIIRRPMINAPVNLTAEVTQGPGFTVGGVRLEWQDGDNDTSSEDRLGNRASLADSSVRTLYQIERRKVGDERWEEFPMIENRILFDPAPSVGIPGKKRTFIDEPGVNRPKFRPTYIETNQTYVYRVKAVQTGSYVSNYSNYAEVFAALKISEPKNFRVRASDVKVKPFYIVLNWDTSNDSGVVDKWEIERADVNNFAAARLNLKNPSDFQTLNFKTFRTVFRESSRFRSQGMDETLVVSNQKAKVFNQTNLQSIDKNAFTGTHQFQDTSISFGNTYFYRIRAVGVDGTLSAWVYRGMKVAEQHTDKMIRDMLTPDIKKSLSDNKIPMIVPGIGGRSRAETSLSLQPQFSKPADIAQVRVGVPPPVQLTVQNPSTLATYNLQTVSVKPTVPSSTTVRAQLLGLGK